MMEKITVMKIGGNVIDNPEALKAFLAEFTAVEGPKILVHGGGVHPELFRNDSAQFFQHASMQLLHHRDFVPPS